LGNLLSREFDNAGKRTRKSLFGKDEKAEAFC